MLKLLAVFIGTALVVVGSVYGVLILIAVPFLPVLLFFLAIGIKHVIKHEQNFRARNSTRDVGPSRSNGGGTEGGKPRDYSPE